MICWREADKPCQKCCRMRPTGFTSNRPQKLTNKLREEKKGKAEKGVGQLQSRTYQQFILYFILFSFRMHGRHSNRSICWACECFTPKVECVSVPLWVWVCVCGGCGMRCTMCECVCLCVCMKCSFCESNKSAAIKMPSIAKCNNNNSNKQQLKRWLTLTLWRCQYLLLVPNTPSSTNYGTYS